MRDLRTDIYLLLVENNCIERGGQGSPLPVEFGLVEGGLGGGDRRFGQLQLRFPEYQITVNNAARLSLDYQFVFAFGDNLLSLFDLEVVFGPHDVGGPLLDDKIVVLMVDLDDSLAAVEPPAGNEPVADLDKLPADLRLERYPFCGHHRAHRLDHHAMITAAHGGHGHQLGLADGSFLLSFGGSDNEDDSDDYPGAQNNQRHDDKKEHGNHSDQHVSLSRRVAVDRNSVRSTVHFCASFLFLSGFSPAAPPTLPARARYSPMRKSISSRRAWRLALCSRWCD